MSDKTSALSECSFLTGAAANCLHPYLRQECGQKHQCLRTHVQLPPIEENRSRPATPEQTTTIGSGTFQRHRTRRVRQAIVAVDRSRIECRARTKTAPAMAPVAAAVTPLTNALMPVLRENRR